MKLEGANRLRALKTALIETTFFDDPASTKYHGAYAGGLAAHSFNVVNNLQHLTEKLGLRWITPESPTIIGLAHDVCKIGAYIPNNTSTVYTWNPNQPPGHGGLSVERTKEWIELTEEEEACIRYHMGAFCNKDIVDIGRDAIQREWNRYTDAIHQFPNVLYTHTADMMASHIDEVSHAETTSVAPNRGL